MTTPEKPAMSPAEMAESKLDAAHDFVHAIVNDGGVTLQVRGWELYVGCPPEFPAETRDHVKASLQMIWPQAVAVVATRDLIRRAQYEARGQRALTKGT